MRARRGRRAALAEEFVERLACARIGQTFNFYRDGPRAGLLRERLSSYLAQRAAARILLVAEAPGHRGARVSGIPLTSERQLTGSGPAEATATIVHAALADLGLTEEILLWNIVPTHPGEEHTSRAPTRAEVADGLPFALELCRGRRVLPVGRVAWEALGGEYLRHPSHGGAAAFRRGLATLVLDAPRTPARGLPATIEDACGRATLSVRSLP